MFIDTFDIWGFLLPHIIFAPNATISVGIIIADLWPNVHLLKVLMNMKTGNLHMKPNRRLILEL